MKRLYRLEEENKRGKYNIERREEEEEEE